MLESLLSYLQDNWPEIVWIVGAAGIASYLAGFRARSRWRKRDFLDRLNVSLSSFQDGKLRIRTLLEMDGESIFLNRIAAQRVVAYARETTEENPILPIPESDCWQYLNAVLNEISEQFSQGQLKRDMGLPVDVAEYLICLTCERAGPVRTQKVRAMVVRKEVLLSLPEEEPQYESENHRTRWQTLCFMKQHYLECPYRFMTMEICF